MRVLKSLSVVVGLQLLAGCAVTNQGNVHGHDWPRAEPVDGHVVKKKKKKDTDGDGIADRKDSCPKVVGTAEFAGCPERQLARLADGKIEILDAVYFATASDVIEERSHALLNNIAAIVADHDEITKVTIEGHSDNVGDAAANKDLSQKRATAVSTYLANKGVAASRMNAVGFGQEQPVADNATEEGRASNRRVAFVLEVTPDTDDGE